jgi:RNA polymerase sigma factor (TIGR02999 family)
MEELRQPNDVTRLLIDWNKGDSEALNALMPLVYDELRRIARRHLQGERFGHTLQSTALVHEAFLRLIDVERIQWQNRAHFIAMAAQMIRRILVDHARTRKAEKRGSGAMLLELDEGIVAPGGGPVDLVDLNNALEKLAVIDDQQARIVELRFFGGLSVEETAEVLGISTPTVKRDWKMARAWLFQQMVQ